MRVVIAGSSGLIGSALVPAMRRSGHEVVRLVRRTAQAPDERGWDPPSAHIEPGALDGADAVINLCGAGIGQAPSSTIGRERDHNPLLGDIDREAFVAAVLADLLLGPLDHAVTLAGHRGFDVALGGDLEALFGARFGLQLRHFASSLTARPSGKHEKPPWHAKGQAT